MKEYQKNIYGMAFISIVLLIGILYWIHYLSANNYIVENFDTNDSSYHKYRHNHNIPINTTYSCNSMCGPTSKCSSKFESSDTDNLTNHNVNMPINTSYSCTNICGPNNRCSKTGGQCLSDLDCYGCKPKNMVIFKTQKTSEVSGLNESGKLTTAITPTFSVLTTDIGTKAMPIEDEPGYSKPKPTSAPPNYSKGINTWKKTFDVGTELFNRKYNPGQQVYTQTYPKRTTLSGEFMNDGPPAANEYF